MPTLDLEPDACRGRQRRLLEVMGQRNIDLVVVTQIPHVQWLTGVRTGWMYQPTAALDADGNVMLVAPYDVPDLPSVDTRVTYEAQKLFTLRNDQRSASCKVQLETLGQRRYRRAATEFSTFPRDLESLGQHWIDIEADLYRLRRRKDADELVLLRHAIGATERMYDRARALIRPGIGELEMFNELQSVAVDYLGEMLTGTGNDYQCASLGGPPRSNRVAASGELYILDLGPAYRGYFADNCRTLAVTQPTGVQNEAWTHVMNVFDYVQATARPGVSCRTLFYAATEILDQAPVGQFVHHLGHGIGLFPHEAPHLNPNWDDLLEVGDVFTVEPGLYAPELNAGLRIENDYLVTESGVERLTNFSDEL